MQEGTEAIAVLFDQKVKLNRVLSVLREKRRLNTIATISKYFRKWTVCAYYACVFRIVANYIALRRVSEVFACMRAECQARRLGRAHSLGMGMGVFSYLLRLRLKQRACSAVVLRNGRISFFHIWHASINANRIKKSRVVRCWFREMQATVTTESCLKQKRDLHGASILFKRFRATWTTTQGMLQHMFESAKRTRSRLVFRLWRELLRLRERIRSIHCQIMIICEETFTQRIQRRALQSLKFHFHAYRSGRRIFAHIALKSWRIYIEGCYQKLRASAMQSEFAVKVNNRLRDQCFKSWQIRLTAAETRRIIDVKASVNRVNRRVFIMWGLAARHFRKHVNDYNMDDF